MEALLNSPLGLEDHVSEKAIVVVRRVLVGVNDDNKVMDIIRLGLKRAVILTVLVISKQDPSLHL